MKNIQSDNVHKDISSVINELIKEYYSKDIKVINLASGITPAYELGDFYLREILVNHEIMMLLEREGIPAQIYLFIYDHDPLNERYLRNVVRYFTKISVIKSLNTSILTMEMNKPLFKIQDFLGCHKSLSDHFLDLFLDKLEYIGLITDIKVIRMSQIYMNKKFREIILEKILSNYNIIREILVKYNRNLLLRYLDNNQKYVDITIRISNDELKELIEREIKYRFFKVSAAIEFAYRWWWFDIHFEPFSQKYFSGNKALFYVVDEIGRNMFAKSIITLRYGLLRFHLVKDKYESMPSEFLDLNNLKQLILKKLHKEYTIQPSEIEGHIKANINNVKKNYDVVLILYELISSLSLSSTNVIRKYTLFSQLRNYLRLYEIARIKNMIPSYFIESNLSQNAEQDKDRQLAIVICDENTKLSKNLYEYFYKRFFNTTKGPRLTTFINHLPYFAKLLREILCSMMRGEDA